MATDDDLFGAFGDDDSDSDQSEEENDVTRKAQALMQKANATSRSHTNSVDSNRFPSADKTEQLPAGPSTESVDLTNLEPCNLPWDPPLYLCSDVKLVFSLPFGGGRGYVALKNLSPGTLVLLEKPIMVWPEEQIGNALTLLSAQHVLSHPNAAKIIHDIEDFHPTKAVVDSSAESDNPEQVEEMIGALHEKHDKDPLLTNLVQLAQNISVKNRDATALTSTDIERIVLALRYNGLESGVYCHVAMLNHKCQPNCVKFLPDSEESDSPPGCSEVRTTRPVQAGESLTISYMPTIVSHASRRRHLWEQHRFDIGVDLDANLRSMEFINGGLPSSSREYVDGDSTTSRIEHAIAEMESLKESLSNPSDYASESWEHAKALEVSSLELFSEASDQLQNDNHLLLIPCLALHLDTCILVLQRDATTSALNNSQRCKLIGRQVLTALRLIDLQKAYWGSDHFDLARTYLDLAQAIEDLLSKSPRHLFELATKKRELRTFRDWSSLEFQSRKAYERIKALYPRDAALRIIQMKDKL
jgi:hypothetical protein